MSNLPMGAEYDEYAPYNAKEETFGFTLVVDGTAWYEYYGDLDVEEAALAIKERLRAALTALGDIDIDGVDLSIE